MAGYVASGATFTFCGVRALATRVSVESPTAEIVDMTPHNGPLNQMVLVPTGAAASGGAVEVEFLQSRNANVSPLAAVGRIGTIAFSGNVPSISVRGICENVSLEAATGDVVRGTMRFRLTDYPAIDSISGSSF